MYRQSRDRKKTNTCNSFFKAVDSRNITNITNVFIFIYQFHVLLEEDVFPRAIERDKRKSNPAAKVDLELGSGNSSELWCEVS